MMGGSEDHNEDEVLRTQSQERLWQKADQVGYEKKKFCSSPIDRYPKATLVFPLSFG